MTQSLLALVLAAGKGTRMHSAKPKVLQPLGGRPLITHLLDTLHSLPNSRTAIIYGYQGEILIDALSPAYPELSWVEQKQQLGTGHAALQALPLLQDDGMTLIVLGDGPLLRLETLTALLAAAETTGAALLTAKTERPAGYGRILREENGTVRAIVEEKDCTFEERKITEINTGVMAVRNELLRKYLPQISNDNAQQEYYLTDLIGLLYAAGSPAAAVIAANSAEVSGINDRAQLAAAEAVLRKRCADALMASGVTLIDPARIDVHGTVTAGSDVVIEPNVMFKGTVALGNNVVIETGSVLENCRIGDNVHIHAHSIIERAQVEAGAQIGPFARLRPNTHLLAGSKIGNFVEIKAATIGEGSKVNHLSYVGDAVLGRDVNVGAGTITCNYDGANKWQTTVGDNVFIGSNTALVAPVTLGSGATVGAGSVITKSVEEGALAFTRSPLKQKSGWQRLVKKK